MRQSTRVRPAKAALSHDAVVKAGLEVLRDKGIDGVTMRAVAAELETGAASLYVYVKDRRELLNQMFDAVAGEVDLGDAPDSKRWREQLEQLLTRVRDAMNRHPGIARVPLGNVPTGPGATSVSERLLALLAAGGVDDRSAAWFVDVVFLYVNAAAYETAVYVERDAGEEEFDRISTGFAQLDADRFPVFFQLLPLLQTGTYDERFAFGLQLMINGLLNTDPPQGSAASA